MTIDPASDLSPLGKGELVRPRNGNATLKTQGYATDGTLKSYETPLWIVSISTDLELSFSEARLRRGVSYTPVRQQERMLSFSAWFKAGGSYDLLSRRIRAHWRVMLNTTDTTPMVFTYYGAGRQWLGFVEEIRHGAKVGGKTWTQRDFTMRIINADASSRSAVLDRTAPYVPSRGDVRDSWEGWYTQGQLAAEAAVQLGVVASGDAPSAAAADIDPDTGGIAGGVYGPPTLQGPRGTQ